MTAKTATITVRLDPQVKREAQEVLKKLGITTSQAIAMYFSQISAEKALPYHPHVPNAETERALADKDLHTARDVDDLFKQLAA
jgi:DNA-damage-inducible protein J